MELGVRHFQTNPYLWVIQWLLTTSDAWSRIPKQLFAIPIQIGNENEKISETSKEIYTNTIGFVPYFDIVLYIYVHRDDYILCIYH